MYQIIKLQKEIMKDKNKAILGKTRVAFFN